MQEEQDKIREKLKGMEQKEKEWEKAKEQEKQKEKEPASNIDTKADIKPVAKTTEPLTEQSPLLKTGDTRVTGAVAIPKPTGDEANKIACPCLIL